MTHDLNHTWTQKDNGVMTTMSPMVVFSWEKMLLYDQPISDTSVDNAPMGNA